MSDPLDEPAAAPERRAPREPGPDAVEEANFRADLALVLSVAATVLLYELPFAQTIAWPLVLLSTLAHELGHGLTALALGGRFESLVISSDASGVARCWAPGDVREALVSAGGLVGPAVAAAFLFVLARRPLLARLTLVLMGAGLGATVPFLIEGGYAQVFVSAVALVFLGVGARAPTWFARHALAFVAVQLSLSVWSRSDYLFTPVARMKTGDMPSDVANMSRHLGLPYWFWGVVCGGASIVLLVVGAWLFLRGFWIPIRRPRRGPASRPTPTDIR